MTTTQDTQLVLTVGVRPVAGHIGVAPRDIEHLDLQRTLHRVTLVGEVPVGPDGGESELVAGKPFTSKHTVVVAD